MSEAGPEESKASLFGASLALLLVHAVGAVLALQAVSMFWSQRLLITLIADRRVALLPFLSGFAPQLTTIFFWVTLATTAAAGVFCAFQVVAIARQMWRGKPVARAWIRTRVAIYLTAACTLLGVLWLSTPEALSGPFRVRFPVTAELLAMYTLAGYAVWSLRLGRRPPAERGRFARMVDVAAMNLVVVAVIGEFGLRVVAALVPNPLFVTDESSANIRRDAERQLPGALRFGYPINLGGHYDSEFLPRNERSGPVVVSIGDSFSYGTVPHPLHYTSVIERERPGVEVYNMGYPGTGPLDYRHLLEGSAVALDPDLILIQLFIGNDVSAGYKEIDPPRWHDADSYLFGIVWHRIRLLSKIETDDWTKRAEAAGAEGGDLAVRFPWVADYTLEKASMGPQVYMGLESRNAAQIGTGRPMVYELYFDSLQALIDSAYPIPIAFVLIPDEFQVEDGLWDAIRAASDLELDRDLAQRKTVEWLNERDVPVLDLLPIMRAVEKFSDGDRHLYHLRDTHWNARGNEVAGKAMAGFVERLLDDERSVASLPLQIDLVGGNAATYLRQGWHEADDGIVWSDGPQSTLLVPAGEGSGDIELSFDCLPLQVAGETQRLDIELNGTSLGEIVLRPGKEAYSVSLPRKLLRRHRNLVTVRYAYTYQPRDVIEGSVDSRELSVAWYSIRFEEKSNAAESVDH